MLRSYDHSTDDLAWSLPEHVYDMYTRYMIQQYSAREWPVCPLALPLAKHPLRSRFCPQMNVMLEQKQQAVSMTRYTSISLSCYTT